MPGHRFVEQQEVYEACRYMRMKHGSITREYVEESGSGRPKKRRTLRLRKGSKKREALPNEYYNYMNKQNNSGRLVSLRERLADIEL